MTAADRGAFAELFAATAEYYGEPMTATRLEIYFAALDDLSLADVRKALNAIVRTSKFFPRVAEIREVMTGTVEDQAELAWSRVLKLIRSNGWVTPPTDAQWGDPGVKVAAMELFGGWQALCESLPLSGVGLVTAANQFKATYRANVRQEARTFQPSKDEARARLSDLKAQLTARGLPSRGLP